MRANRNFSMENVMGKKILIDLSGAFRGMIELNETSAEIWRAIADGCSEQEAAQRLTAQYEVSEEKALESVRRFCADMVQQGVFEE